MHCSTNRMRSLIADLVLRIRHLELQRLGHPHGIPNTQYGGRFPKRQQGVEPFNRVLNT